MDWGLLSVRSITRQGDQPAAGQSGGCVRGAGAARSVQSHHGRLVLPRLQAAQQRRRLECQAAAAAAGGGPGQQVTERGRAGAARRAVAVRQLVQAAQRVGARHQRRTGSVLLLRAEAVGAEVLAPGVLHEGATDDRHGVAPQPAIPPPGSALAESPSRNPHLHYQQRVT